MRVILKSDFRDFYDVWFDLDGDYTYERLTTSGMSRGAMFKFLIEQGIPTVKYGSCEDLKYSGCKEVVVYMNTKMHRGEGKVLMSANDAYISVPNYLASEYVNYHKGVSIRHLQLGKFWFKIQYVSQDDWRSNCGKDIDIQLLKYGCGYHNTIKYPTFAIDYVQTEKGLLAVDYNIAPGCKWTGVEKVVSPKEVAESIKDAIRDNLISSKCTNK